MPSLKKKYERSKRVTRKTQKGGAPQERTVSKNPLQAPDIKSNNLPTEQLNNVTLPGSPAKSRRQSTTANEVNANFNPINRTPQGDPKPPTTAWGSPDTLLGNDNEAGEVTPVQSVGDPPPKLQIKIPLSNEEKGRAEGKAVTELRAKQLNEEERKKKEGANNSPAPKGLYGNNSFNVERNRGEIQKEANDKRRAAVGGLNFNYKQFLPKGWEEPAAETPNSQVVSVTT